ncbi:pantothenate kinase [Candidatus Desantisbacteria bacterium CG_4_9_14_3_um_filter_40_11]|uniref:Type III pantothenate kinase n=2 Tax=unclassified Candidatus Desantisiibacteriota TaxID=3106372 RepID=A0A2M8AWM3_9BACT|nr:MAG: pantothenate kinase [Candidatus Desantisbacteria bacterium CG23_combo_of_CG06-09_8_20_14_all_40_23]PJB30519.1 MAG: pantothenate kinase [Candidatus Desantisbacteria bacterium CG_4_9_14_3_um_filter_40_11]
MILVIDIGNTKAHFGIYIKDKLSAHWSLLNSEIKRNNNIISVRLKEYNILKCTISCVVPSLKDVFNKILDDFSLTPVFIEYSSIDIPIYYNNPSELGVDRIINVVAVIKLYEIPCIIVDFGTATTIDVVSDKGEFIGGVIVPGIGVSAETLWTKTEKLPHIEINKPKTVIGKNTIDCMQSGIFYGSIGQVDEIIKRIMKELGYKTNVIATGGLSNIIGKYSKYIKKVDEFLILEGLKILTR